MKLSFLKLFHRILKQCQAQRHKAMSTKTFHPGKLSLYISLSFADLLLTYQLLQKGDAKGVFQFESDGIRELLKRMKPDNIRDLIACTALYRPGPLGGGMVETLHRDAAPVNLVASKRRSAASRL